MTGDVDAPDCAVGNALLAQGQFDQALEWFREAACRHPDYWYAWFGAGQAARRLERIPESREFLARATALAPDHPPVRLAHGIAEQLSGNLDEAKVHLRRAIDLEGDLAMAYNSLGVTHRLAGEYREALRAYEGAVHALARNLAGALRNDRNGPIAPPFEFPGDVWMDCTMTGAMWLWARDREALRLTSLGWPTADAAMEEDRTHAHGGLYYEDRDLRDGRARHFLPNFFNTYHWWLRGEPFFAVLVANQATAYRMLGDAKMEEARQREAELFGAGRDLSQSVWRLS